MRNPWPRVCRRLTRRIAGLFSLLSLANFIACTEYSALRTGAEPGAGKAVRVTLTDQGKVDVARVVGLRASRVEGVLQSLTDSSLSLSVERVSREGGVEDTYAGEQLSLQRQDFETVEASRTSVTRSVLLAGAIIASAFLIAKGAGDVSGGKTGGPPPPPTH